MANFVHTVANYIQHTYKKQNSTFKNMKLLVANIGSEGLK